MAGSAVVQSRFGYVPQQLNMGVSACQNAGLSPFSFSYTSSACNDRLHDTQSLCNHRTSTVTQSISTPVFLSNRPFSRSIRRPIGLRCQATGMGGDSLKPGGGNGKETGRSSVSEALVRALEAQRQGKGMVEDPLKGNMTAASKQLQEQLDKVQNIVVGEGQGMAEGGSPQSWADWERVFQEVEEREPLLKALQAQLTEAVEQEDFKEAGRIKATIKAIEGEDVVREVVTMFETAVKEERFDDASQLRDAACAGLVGWWAGVPLSDREYSGALVRVVPGKGKLTGYAMTPKHLVEGGAGQEVMEIYVVKDKTGKYHQQAVYLKRESPFRPDATVTEPPAEEDPVLKVIASSDDPSGDGGLASLRRELGPVSDDDHTDSLSEIDSGAEGDIESGPESVSPEDDEEEEAGMQRVIKYFTDRIPGAKFKVSRVFAPQGKKDVPGLIEKLVLGLQEAMAQGGVETRGKKGGGRRKKKTLRGGDAGSVELFEEAARLEEEKLARAQAEINAASVRPSDEAGASDELEASEGEVSESEESTSGSDGEEVVRKRPDDGAAFSFMGLDVDLTAPAAMGEMTSSDRERLEAQARPVRVPAKVTKARGTFVFSVEDQRRAGDGQSVAEDAGLNADEAAVRAAVKAGALSPQDVQAMVRVVELSKVKNLMPKKQLEALMGAVAAHRMSQRGGLARKMLFRKLDPDLINSTDPLSGMYVGGYGPHGLELIQLQRGYGRWDEDFSSPSTSGSPGDDSYEYVEGVKVTGDPNVPAGKVTFRAKVGPKYKLPPIDYTNVDLGTIARYKGQGQLAKPGFKNAHWVDGELLVLDGRLGPKLGFLFDAPGGKGRPVLILFDRWKLPGLHHGIA